METSYPDEAVVKDEMCSHYLTIRSTQTHKEKRRQQANSSTTDRVEVMMEERRRSRMVREEGGRLQSAVRRRKIKIGLLRRTGVKQRKGDEEGPWQKKSAEYVGQVSVKVPVTLERLHCLQSLLSKGDEAIKSTAVSERDVPLLFFYRRKEK
ncbi:hypothetical protein Q8A73_010729 [Channa argus]|nr:hypothetical protein Q8A73_010729 [Channa argus]